MGEIHTYYLLLTWDLSRQDGLIDIDVHEHETEKAALHEVYRLSRQETRDKNPITDEVGETRTRLSDTLSLQSPSAKKRDLLKVSTVKGAQIIE